MNRSLTPQEAYNAAISLHMAGSLAEAAGIYTQILEVEPGHGPALQALGVLHGQQGRYGESSHFLQRASVALPDSADVWSNLGNVLRILERYEDSVTACQRAVELQPKHSFAWGNLAGALRMVGRIRESLAAAETALAIAPGYLEGLVNKGCALQALGRMDDAIRVFEDLTQKHPKSLYAWSCLLLAIQYSDKKSAEELWEAAKSFCATLPPPAPRALPKKILRVGFISGDFCQHPVGLFMRPLLERWNHERHQVHLFSNLAGEDQVTKDLKGWSDGFHCIQGVPDPEAKRLIEAQGIDLLIDLAGHTAKNRIGLLLLKPAPLMASYLGYSATTGLPQMDFMIGDKWATPPEQDQFYVEKVARLPGSLYNWIPRAMAPAEWNPSSCRIGSFNNPAKMSAACLDMWADLMRQEPDLTLVLKYRGFGDPEVQDSFAAELARRGVERDRLEFHGWISREKHFELLSGLALGLDTYPYSGATTTVDFIASGIPVPTLVGDRYVSRMSASVLDAAGLGSLICRTPSEWVDRCRQLLAGGDEAGQVQERLKEVATSRLADVDRFARDFQDLCDKLV